MSFTMTDSDGKEPFAAVRVLRVDESFGTRREEISDVLAHISEMLDQSA